MEQHATLAEALVAALADLTVIEKGRTAKIEKKGGGSFSYDYADLGDTVSFTRPVLAEHGLVALTPVHGHDGRLACTVILLHTSGERETFDPLPFPEGQDARASGSWMTYFRRYALLAALGMATADDDGENATAGSRTRPQHHDDAEPVVTTKEASEALNEVLAAALPAEALADHGAQVWNHVQPRIVGNGRVPQSEVDRLVAAATEHVKALR